MMIKKVILASIVLLILGGCGDRKDEKSSVGSNMKCGAGKCGANMFDGNSALAKKKKNITSQMRKDDPRKECVLKAKTTKEAYDCIREPGGKRHTMKCGEGKCGTNSKVAVKSDMKCGEGKCGAKPVKVAPPVMKCGAGKCGGAK